LINKQEKEMRKEDVHWGIHDLKDYDGTCRVEICEISYSCSQEMAAICHAILLLVDAVNDKPSPEGLSKD
jgi:hypothetical protein